MGAGWVTLESELGEEKAELPRGGVNSPHALSVVGVISGVVGGLQSQTVAKKIYFRLTNKLFGFPCLCPSSGSKMNS